LVFQYRVLQLVVSGFFRNQSQHAYSSRGNIFFILAVGFLAAFALVIVAIFRSNKEDANGQRTDRRT